MLTPYTKKMKNKWLLKIGITQQAVQWLVIGIYLLTLLDWSWFTLKVFKIIMLALGFTIYNSLSIMLIYLGTRKGTKRK